MSARFIAHVHRPDQPVEAVDCDVAHVNEHGYLILGSDSLTGTSACYAPGAWTSYLLEAVPEPVTEEQLLRGEKSLNDSRRWLGFTDAAKQEPRPQVGDRLHVYSDVQGCLPGTVTDTAGLTVVLHLDGYDTGFGSYQSARHDEARTVDGSWHWPHDDEQTADTEPEPDAHSQVTINVTVEGSVLADRDLRRIVDEQIIQHIKRTSGYYSRAFRR